MSDFPQIDVATWRQRVESELKGAGLDSLAIDTLEGLVMAPLYASAEPGVAGFPGMVPFVRGARSEPASPPWCRCQQVVEPDLDRAIGVIEAEREGGVDGLWLRFDRSLRTGNEADAAGDGILAVDPGDLARLLAAAGEADLTVRLGAGANVLPVSAAFFAAIERLGRRSGSLRLHLGMDPLGALAADGALPATIEALASEAALLAGRAAGHLPGVVALSVDTAPYARAGADAAQQLAIAMATAVEYLRWLEARGVGPDVAAGQIDFLFETDRHFLLEVAKLRAARLLWTRVQAACELEPRPAWIHASTGWRTYTRKEPWTNLLRATVQATAAIVGGADAVTTMPFDAPLGTPGRLGTRLARSTQAILAEESSLGWPVDPAGGAYAVETLTNELAASAWERLQAIEAAGGMLACLRAGTMHESLAESTRRRAQRIREGRSSVLGVTDFPAPAPTDAQFREVDSRPARAVDEGRLDERPGVEAHPDLESLAAAAAGNDPGSLGEALMSVARDGATIFEMGSAMRPEPAPAGASPLPAHRDEDLAAAEEAPR